MEYMGGWVDGFGSCGQLKRIVVYLLLSKELSVGFKEGVN